MFFKQYFGRLEYCFGFRGVFEGMVYLIVFRFLQYNYLIYDLVFFKQDFNRCD